MIRKLISGYSEELVRGVTGVAGLRVLGVLIGYVFVIIVSRNFGATALGEYQLTVQVVATCTLFSTLGFNQLTLKYGSRYGESGKVPKPFKKALLKWVGVAISASLVTSFLLAIFSEGVAIYFFSGEEAKKYILLAAVVVPFQLFNSLACELFRSLKLIAFSEYLRSIHVRCANLVIVAAFVLYSERPGSDIVVFSFMVATISAFVLAVLIFWKKIQNGNDQAPDATADNEINELTLKKSLGQSWPMYQSLLLMFASTQALVYILAYFESPAEVAKYNVSLQVANLANFIFASVVTVAAPMYSRDYSAGHDKLKQTIRESSRIIFWASGTASLGIGLLSYPILLVFGDVFAQAWNVLVILAAANFINAFTGASGNLLDMTGGHKWRKNILFVNAALTLLVAFYAIHAFGAAGAAIAYFFNMCFGNIVGVYVVYKRLGINMMYFPWQKVSGS